MVALAACAAFAESCSPPERPHERPNVLWITVDTLRADHLGCYGYARATSPAIDALASEGMLFLDAQSPRAKTTPSLASLFTGLYPHEHGVRELLQPLARDVPVFTERLRADGYRTAAIVGNFVLRGDLAGLNRGFEAWTESLPERVVVPPDSAPQRAARSLTDAALVALGLARAPLAEASGAPFEPQSSFRVDGAPWFLWLHYMDPHGTYAPPQEHCIFEDVAPERIAPTAPSRAALHRQRVAEYNVPADARLPDGAIDAARVRARYDAEIRYVDTQIARLVDELKRAGLWDTTLVVLTADHGESLGEHDYWFEHGVYAYQATCRVPLIVKLAGGAQAGARAGNISLVDIAPTLLDVLGLPPLASGTRGVRGVSRAALFDGEVAAPHAVYSEKIDGAGALRAIQIKAVRIGNWKLLRRYALLEGDAAPAALKLLSEELYDLDSDPLETRDLASSPPARAPLQELRRALPLFVREDPYFREVDRLLRRSEAERDAETESALRALGYF